MINLEISQFDNNYITYLNYYNKLLKQRNVYLKSINEFNVNLDYLDIIDKQLINYGIKIRDIRKKFVDDINKEITTIYNVLGGIGNLSLDYKTEYDMMSFDEIVKLIKKGIKKDIIFGSTQCGIHHDDFIFMINDIEMKEYGSEGQQKNSIIAFKLAEMEIFNKRNNEYPILVLDDLFSELDVGKIEKILKYIKPEIQTFITTTDLKKIKKAYLKNSKIFKLSKNGIKEEIYE